MTHPVIEAVLSKDPYDQLPEPIKMLYTREQWLWLSDQEKATLVQRETECEYDE
jgi:hypothetical protein